MQPITLKCRQEGGGLHKDHKTWAKEQEFDNPKKGEQIGKILVFWRGKAKYEETVIKWEAVLCNDSKHGIWCHAVQCKSQLCSLISTWLWANYLTTLRFNFPIQKIGNNRTLQGDIRFI